MHKEKRSLVALIGFAFPQEWRIHSHHQTIVARALRVYENATNGITRSTPEIRRSWATSNGPSSIRHSFSYCDKDVHCSESWQALFCFWNNSYPRIDLKMQHCLAQLSLGMTGSDKAAYAARAVARRRGS